MTEDFQHSAGSADGQAIWERELKIFEHRARGDMAYYLSIMSENFIAWPAWAEAVVYYSDMAEKFGRAGALPSGERISLTPKGIRIDGDTAMSYFQTHRTCRPGGERTNERFNNIHVWVKRADDWRIVSSMSYPVLARLEP